MRKMLQLAFHGSYALCKQAYARDEDHLTALPTAIFFAVEPTCFLCGGFPTILYELHHVTTDLLLNVHIESHIRHAGHTVHPTVMYLSEVFWNIICDRVFINFRIILIFCNFNQLL